MQIDPSDSHVDVQLEQAGDIRLLDLEPSSGDLLGDSLSGLRSSPKTLPCKYFYDALGSELFEKITDLPEYYPTRTEISLMAKYGPEIADAIGEIKTGEVENR